MIANMLLTRRHPCKQGGFTLLEMVIVIVILGVMASIAIPNFTAMLRAQRVRTAAYDLMASLQFARSEAIKRNGNVVVAAATGGWQNGWTVTSGTTVLRSQNAFSSNISISETTSQTSLTYRKDGRASSGINVSLNTNPTDSNAARCVRITTSGRPATSTGGCS